MALILPIGPGSDGDANKRPPSDKAYTRNDQYFLEKVATEKWIKDLPGGARPGVKYQLDRLPAGYAGFEKHRSNSTTHVDRYLYGHPNGPFRSLNEFYPHFKHLMENGTAIGCPCKLCISGSSRGKKVRNSGGRVSEMDSITSGSPIRQSPFFAQPQESTVRSEEQSQRQVTYAQVNVHGLLQGRPKSPQPQEPRRKQVDEEGTIDVYRKLLDKLKAKGPEGKVDEPIVESTSPDWRAGQDLLEETLEGFKDCPNYGPRHGEVVMFVRDLGAHETLGWDNQIQTWRVVGSDGRWLDRPRWEAGVVTQTPTEAVSAADLAQAPAEKENSVVYTGYRVEPMPKPGSMTKTYTKQHRYAPLHAMRPFSLWEDCIGKEADSHPTINHALIMASSFSIVGKFHFKGTWPEATVFAKGVFIGPELVLVGDTVRLYPRAREQRGDAVTDIMVITAVKLKFVNLDEAGDDDYDDDRPYNTCLHVSGKAYTMDPSRSYDGVGKLPIKSDQKAILPPGLMALSQWYHILDPKRPKLRLEVPYHRILGRCHEQEAITSWYTPPAKAPPPSSSSFQAVNAAPTLTLNNVQSALATYDSITHGLRGVQDARAYSLANDHRIQRDSGGTWFWADTRIEQLDLHEVNSTFVGIKDNTRGSKQMDEWRRALKALDGKAGGLEEYRAAKKERERERARRLEGASASAGMGMISSAVQTAGVDTSAFASEIEEEMEVDNRDGHLQDMDQMMGVSEDEPVQHLHSGESDVEMEESHDALAAFKAKAAPAKAVIPQSTLKKQEEIISLLDSDEG